MTSVPRSAKRSPDALPTSLVISAISIAGALWIFGTGFFTFHFRELRFVYYAIVVSSISFAIYMMSVRYPAQRALCVIASTFTGYVASVVSYLILTSPFLPKTLATAHWEILLLIWILPIHGLFVLSGFIAGLVMIGVKLYLRE